jgi:Peptidase family M41
MLVRYLRPCAGMLYCHCFRPVLCTRFNCYYNSSATAVCHIRARQVSVVRREKIGGFVLLRDTDHLAGLREHYLDDLAVWLAGRAAEDVCCGTISSGCASDLKHVSADCTDSVTITLCSDAILQLLLLLLLHY